MTALYTDTQTGEYPLTAEAIRSKLKNTSFSKKISDSSLESLGFSLVCKTSKPAGDVVFEGLPQEAEGLWYQTWVTRSFTQQEVELNEKRRLDSIKLGVLSVDKWTMLADGVDVVRVTYTTDKVAYFVVNGEVRPTYPTNKVAELFVSVTTPGAVNIQLENVQFTVVAFEATAP
jgi:hypothetical protein